MTNHVSAADPSKEWIQLLTQNSFLFYDFDEAWLEQYLTGDRLNHEKLYSNRPIYTAFRPNESLGHLYVVLSGGPVIVRSTPLDRIIALTYPGGCFGMRNLDVSYGNVCRAFPSLVEAYKTTDVITIPTPVIQSLYEESEVFRTRYGVLFELREKFQYHLLNCGTYPPQAVASLLRAVIYQERSLCHDENREEFVFDLPVDIISRACQLNHRTVEQVLKGMAQIKMIETAKSSDAGGDLIRVLNPEGLKEVYGTTRDKVPWWPLK
ncbi:MAG: Crp/Fnr family transcriptional regulator [Leptolyngbyaceae bacterium]|nr:Crp/Fnr family transcriptional regulator [Leptolyngbyaceae bacterium]